MTGGSSAPAFALRWSAPDPVKQMPSAAYLPLLRQAVEAAPDRVEFRLQLARALVHAGLLREVVERFGPPLDAGAHPEVLFHLGRAVAALGDDALAASVLARSAQAGYGLALGPLAEAQFGLGRPDEALATALRALERSALDFTGLRIAALVLLRRGERERLWDLCEQLRARGRCSAYLPSVMVLAATGARQRREVEAIVGDARWFAASTPAVPEGFNERLSAELLGHELLAELPATKSTRGAGNRIDQIELAGGPLAQELLARIRDAVEAYALARRDDDVHPMVADRPASVVLNAWAVTVRGDGHEGWHLHPDGWISGVYYVRVPELGAGGDPPPGSIAFGPHPFAGERDDSPWPRRRVTPHAGLLLLFPSYYAHRTWPTGVDEPRLCVAFDVVPRERPVRAAGDEGS